MKAIKTHNASQNIDAYDQCMIKIVYSSELQKNIFEKNHKKTMDE